MNSNKAKYIDKYNKENYTMFQFRVKKTDTDILNRIQSQENKTEYINGLIKEDINREIYSIKKIRSIIVPILNSHNIYEVYLFGSYARGEARTTSDIDIYCEKGNIKTLIDYSRLINELSSALGKDVDVVFSSARMNPIFRERMMEDLIKLC
ncbi:MAG: nucleotidyltransferase domain-containing protein [Clostridia bacterium]|nr:nucleotidyltransferase domain-containing protein [Clostridia bacterium]